MHIINSAKKGFLSIEIYKFICALILISIQINIVLAPLNQQQLTFNLALASTPTLLGVCVFIISMNTLTPHALNAAV